MFVITHEAIHKALKGAPAYKDVRARLLKEDLLKEMIKELIYNPTYQKQLEYGGVKIEDKAPVIKNLLPKTSQVLLGSGALNDRRALPKSPKIVYPSDWIAEGNQAFDIGPLTVEEYSEVIKKAKTIIWNGPLGYFENVKYAGGSKAIAKLVAQSKAHTIVGGGETTELILSMKLEKKIGFLSTGGGAMLDFLAGKKLPGIVALG